MKKWLLLMIMWSAGAGAQEVRRALPVTTSADETAKFLAGVPLPEDAVLAPLQRSQAYTEHVTELARLTQHYDKNYFSKMRAWSAAELSPRIPMNRPVYYFFGGPDAVSVLALFPDAPVYILSGLESAGEIPDPRSLSPEVLAEALKNIRESSDVILSYGHFITKDMKTDLDSAAFRGVLPLILTFIALTGGEVTEIESVGVNRDGTLAVPSPGETKGKLPGIKVTFRRGPGANAQVMYYVQADASNDAIKANKAILTWAGGFGPGTVYLKAASYLLHEEYFSRIRDFLLTRGAAVLQDDSGIPFRFFQNENWRCWLFGTYGGTLDIFQKYQQPDLFEAFSATNAAVGIPFGTGYKWRLGESNLLLAVRQEVRRAEPVE